MIKEQKKSHIEYDCQYAILFCTKYRKPILTEQVKDVLEAKILDFFNQSGLVLNECQIEPESVYLRVEIDPQLSVNQVVRRLKIETSKLLRQEFDVLTRILPSIWTFNYCCTTKGVYTKEEQKAYILKQPLR